MFEDGEFFSADLVEGEDEDELGVECEHLVAEVEAALGLEGVGDVGGAAGGGCGGGEVFEVC